MWRVDFAPGVDADFPLMTLNGLENGRAALKFGQDRKLHDNAAH
jgi:hypothetical protein